MRKMLNNYVFLAKKYHNDYINLTCKLCTISSPSYDEKNKADYIIELLKDDYPNIYKDEVGNVIVDMKGESDELSIFTAHIDTVFPHGTKLNPEIKDDRIWCPSVGDNTANVAAMIILLKYLKSSSFELTNNIKFVFSVGEEGLGNLYGVKHLMKNVSNVKEFIAVDCGYKLIDINPVGSKRYEIEVETEGGHSYFAYGRKNAILEASKLINELYAMKIENINGSKTTINVGTISGGTSVNTIASKCSFLFEYRSSSDESIKLMDNHFKEIIDNFSKSTKTSVKLLGERPSKGNVDANKHRELIDKVRKAIFDVVGEYPTESSGSMDFNIAMSMGIPGVSIGCYEESNCHCLDENIKIDGMKKGLEVLFRFFDNYIK